MKRRTFLQWIVAAPVAQSLPVPAMPAPYADTGKRAMAAMVAALLAQADRIANPPLIIDTGGAIRQFVSDAGKEHWLKAKP